MKVVFELKDIVWFLLGWLVPILVGKVLHFFSELMVEKSIKKGNAQYLWTGINICPLFHGLPFFERSDLILQEPMARFHFSIPKELYARICKRNGAFEHTKWEKPNEYWDSEDVSSLLSAILRISTGISKEELLSLVKDKQNDVANLFLEKSDQPFFNGEMYGIKDIKDRRVGNEERARVEITSIKTDYYTHRVMDAVYQELLHRGHVKSPTGIESIGSYYPFLTSLGMDVLLVIENKKKVVLTKRSARLFNMQEDQWHLSMNEAISVTDLDLGSISLERCVWRGLKEELGLDSSTFNHTSLHYSDLFFLKIPLEVGLLTFVVVDELTETRVRESYNVAQDAPFESTGNDETGLCFLPITREGIKRFCEANRVTDGAKYALKMLLIRRERL